MIAQHAHGNVNQWQAFSVLQYVCLVVHHIQAYIVSQQQWQPIVQEWSEQTLSNPLHCAYKQLIACHTPELRLLIQITSTWVWRATS